ncbi:MAG TPA: hypothetical protein VN222_13200 [Novosphingobium sp.]|nr:hypothetical protein [Novosphingobium sp.]
MTETLPRTVQGKRPDFFETPGVDDALSMILVLAEEMAVLRERLNSAEIVAARRGIDLAQEIEDLNLDEAILSEREGWRQGFYDRLFYLAKQRRSELEHKHSAQSYHQTIADIAKD